MGGLGEPALVRATPERHVQGHPPGPPVRARVLQVDSVPGVGLLPVAAVVQAEELETQVDLAAHEAGEPPEEDSPAEAAARW